jgi:hypothetical protein
LIDDAAGSGSTLNQIAGKLKQKGIADKVTGLAIVGSFKGFDVVTDVCIVLYENKMDVYNVLICPVFL